MLKAKKNARKKGEMFVDIIYDILEHYKVSGNSGFVIKICGYNQYQKKLQTQAEKEKKRLLLKNNAFKIYDSNLDIVLEGEIKPQNEHWINSFCKDE